MTIYGTNEVLKILRLSNNLSRVELSKKTNLSPAFITELEKGNRNPSIETLQKYSYGLSIPLKTIVYLLEDSKNDNYNFQDLLLKVLLKLKEK